MGEIRGVLLTVSFSNNTHDLTRSGWFSATTVSTNRLVAALDHIPWVMVPGKTAKSEK